MARLFTSTIYAFLSLLVAVNSSSLIPALLWSPERSYNQFPTGMGVDPVKTDDFLNQLLIPLMDNSSGCGVVFLQDKLHMDDFTRYADVYSPNSDGGSFKNIKALVEKHSSMELHQVVDPYKAVVKLKSSFPGDVHTVNSAEDVKRIDLDNDKKTLLIVHLNSVNGQKDLENAIQQNDETVGDIAQHLEKRNIKYKALFTAQATSENQASPVESHSNRRLLATAPSNNGTFMNVSGQIFVFLRAVDVVVVESGVEMARMNLTVDEQTANNSSRSNTSAEIVYSFTNVSSNRTSYNVKITTETKKLQDRWVMTRVSLDVNGGTSGIHLSNATLSPGDMDFTIPIIYSWHCTNMTMYLDSVRDVNNSNFKGTYINLQGYQLQPYNIQKDRFFDAQDCVPYFTTAIWMFLFSSIFLISILVFGVLMVLSLSTMDKYDDPKGKTITVAQGTD